MRKYDVMIASAIGWKDIHEEDGEWYGKPPNIAYSIMVPHYTTSTMDALDLIQHVPEFIIERDKKGFHVGFHASPTPYLATAITATFLALVITREIDEYHINDQQTRDALIKSKEIRRNGE